MDGNGVMTAFTSRFEIGFTKALLNEFTSIPYFFILIFHSLNGLAGHFKAFRIFFFKSTYISQLCDVSLIPFVRVFFFSLWPVPSTISFLSFLLKS